MQLFFFEGQPRRFLVKAFTDNMYIEKSYFLGDIQEPFVESKLDLYTHAAFHNLGKQLYT